MEIAIFVHFEGKIDNLNNRVVSNKCACSEDFFIKINSCVYTAIRESRVRARVNPSMLEINGQINLIIINQRLKTLRDMKNLCDFFGPFQ